MRLVLSSGVPGPWSESAKALVAHKGIPWVAVLHRGGAPNEELQHWTGQSSAPVAIFDDLPPACHWLDLLMLLERIEPARPLVPGDPMIRAQVIGLAALIAGAEGFGWQRRLHMLGPMLAMDPVPEPSLVLAKKYGYSPQAEQEAVARLRQITVALDQQLHSQLENGSQYFVGDDLTAVDYYWASFLGMVMPLPPEMNPMPDWIRPIYQTKDPEVLACITSRLVQHRDMMYKEHITVPLDF